MADKTDSEREIFCILRAQSGSQEALNDLFKLLQEPLFRYIRSLVRDQAQAEDVLQEVFIRIYRKLKWLREPRALRPWAYLWSKVLVFFHFCSITNVRAIYISLQRIEKGVLTKAQLRQAAKEVATKGRKAQGERTRKAILERAVHIASAEGLEGLTIGRLALELSMSKSGLFAHFGSKEDLQVATVEAARAIFIKEVIRPAFESAQGLARLWKLCDIWLAYVQSGVFRGGCFFAAAASEFDGRPGPVRDRIAEIMKEWLATLRNTIIEAQNAGQLDKKIDATQLAFEVNSLELGANWQFQLYGDTRAFTRAREAIHERFGRYATAVGAPMLAFTKPKRTRVRA